MSARGERQKDNTDSYRNNWERIFGKKDKEETKEEVTEEKEVTSKEN